MAKIAISDILIDTDLIHSISEIKKYDTHSSSFIDKGVYFANGDLIKYIKAIGINNQPYIVETTEGGYRLSDEYIKSKTK